MSGEDWHDRQGVSHVVIPEGGDYSLGELPEGMVVYWWNDRPVGHEFVGREKSQASIGRIDSNVLSRISAEEERASQPVYSGKRHRLHQGPSRGIATLSGIPFPADVSCP